MKEAEKTVVKGVALVIIGLLWWLLQEGIIELKHVVPLFLVSLGLVLIAKGLLRGGKGDERK